MFEQFKLDSKHQTIKQYYLQTMADPTDVPDDGVKASASRPGALARAKSWLDTTEITTRPALDYNALIESLQQCQVAAHERIENYFSNEHMETASILKALTDNLDSVVVPLLDIIKLCVMIFTLIKLIYMSVLLL